MASRQPDLAAVVVHFGDDPAALAQTTELVRCLERDATLCEVVLVDNGPGCHEWQATSTTIVEPGHNLGYGGGANAGIDVAIGHGAGDVVVLATDAIVAAGSLAALADAGGHQRVRLFALAAIHLFN